MEYIKIRTAQLFIALSKFHLMMSKIHRISRNKKKVTASCDSAERYAIIANSLVE